MRQGFGNDTGRSGKRTIQDVQHVFQFRNHLANDLPILGSIVFDFRTAEFLLGSADGVALIIKQATDLADCQDVSPLIVAAITPAFYGRELWEFLLPIAEDVSLNRAKLRHFTNGEITLAGNDRQFVVMTGFQHSSLLSA